MRVAVSSVIVLPSGSACVSCCPRAVAYEAAKMRMILIIPNGATPSLPCRYTRSNTAIDSTCEVCGNILTTPALLSW